MTAGVLIRPDPKGRPIAFAILMHASLILAFIGLNLINSQSEKFGDPNAGGANIGVDPVDKIPLPHSGPTNPVAHDTQSEAVQAPPDKVEQEKKEVIPPDAVKLNLQDKKKTKVAKEDSVKHHFKSIEQLQSNQLTTRTPQAVSSPLYTQMPGSGRVGLGANTTLGNRFGAYAQQIQELIARNWRTDDVRVPTAPPVIATFEILRDGSIRSLTILRSSGISSLDFSVRRAIEGVRFPPLPQGFDQNSAKCEFTFELKK